MVCKLSKIGEGRLIALLQPGGTAFSSKKYFTEVLENKVISFQNLNDLMKKILEGLVEVVIIEPFIFNKEPLIDFINKAREKSVKIIFLTSLYDSQLSDKGFSREHYDALYTIPIMLDDLVTYMKETFSK